LDDYSTIRKDGIFKQADIRSLPPFLLDIYRLAKTAVFLDIFM